MFSPDVVGLTNSFALKCKVLLSLTDCGLFHPKLPLSVVPIASFLKLSGCSIGSMEKKQQVGMAIGK